IEKKIIMARECVFCNIVWKKLDADFLFENEGFVIIKDIRPACEFHYLAVPKRHIRDGRDLQSTDKSLLLEMEQELRNLFAKKNIPSDNVLLGFHWPPFISVPHLHMHGLAPTNQLSLITRWMFKPMTYWFRTTDYVLKNINAGPALDERSTSTK
ncbi:Adenosine 5'-monophosphoramidase HINT3, partial [Pseudolycoriella hygida]